MDCPVCKYPMIVLELNRVEIDYCQKCSGIWLDKGELELLLDTEQEKTALFNSFKPDNTAKEKKRKCPICLKKMDKVRLEGILIDKCRLGHGLWFDKGELEEILKKAAGSKSKVLSLLQDMFGLKHT